MITSQMNIWKWGREGGNSFPLHHSVTWETRNQVSHSLQWQNRTKPKKTATQKILRSTLILKPWNRFSLTLSRRLSSHQIISMLCSIQYIHHVSNVFHWSDVMKCIELYQMPPPLFHLIDHRWYCEVSCLVSRLVKRPRQFVLNVLNCIESYLGSFSCSFQSPFEAAETPAFISLVALKDINFTDLRLAAIGQNEQQNLVSKL